GWILEGFPENQEQAWMLQSSGIFPRHVGKQCKGWVAAISRKDLEVFLSQNPQEIQCQDTRLYHMTFDWPSDPLVQQRLVKPGDLSEQEMSKNLLEYRRSFPEVFRVYHKVLKSINADQPSTDV
ncbi:KAD8 kinase, partial [Brachypteracias leptosomus]|nr:KAD8 kinase [Brachypteracias leptosomus]